VKLSEQDCSLFFKLQRALLWHANLELGRVEGLADPAAVARVMDGVRTTSGRIDVLLHAAGLEISRALPDKEPGEFDLVLDVKADGWFNVLTAAGDMPVGATVVFSSVAGRFGNAGQCDYSAANDLLCKVTSSFRRTRPATRGLALDWTAWGGIGMATRGSVPRIMEMAGVEMLPAAAGVAWIRRELTAHAFRGEVVVAGALGRMAAGFDPAGGLDPASFDATVVPLHSKEDDSVRLYATRGPDGPPVDDPGFRSVRPPRSRLRRSAPRCGRHGPCGRAARRSPRR